MLLVEDDQVSSTALSSILRRRGFDVIPVQTVAGAISHLGNNLAFVILDLMLPDGDGSLVLKAIRERGLPARVLVVTGVGDPQRLNAVRELKPELIMQKPIDLSRVLAMLNPLH